LTDCAGQKETVNHLGAISTEFGAILPLGSGRDVLKLDKFVDIEMA